MSFKRKTSRSFIRDHFGFVFGCVLLILAGYLVFISISLIFISKRQVDVLAKQSKVIENFLLDYFEKLNQINLYAGNNILKVNNNGYLNKESIFNILKDTSNIKNKSVESISWTSFDWVNSGGFQIVNSRLGVRPKPIDMSHRSYFKDYQLKPFKLLLSPPSIGNPSNLKVIPAGTSIFSSNNKFLGIVAVGIDINILADRIQKRIDERVEFAIYDNKGNLIINNSFDSNILDKAVVVKINSLVADYGELKNSNFIYRYYNKINEYNYIIFTKYSEYDSKKELFTLIFPYILQFTVISIFFVFTLSVFKRRINYFNFQEKRLNKKILSLNKVLKSLIRSLSHDVKNYIYGVIGLVDVIGKNIDDKNLVKINDDNRALARIIESQSKEMLEYLQDILDKDISKNGISANIDRAKKITSFDIKTMIETTLVVNKKFAEDHQTSFILNFANNIPLLKFNKNSFRAIIDNIVNNAIKYNKICAEVFINVIYLDFRKITTDSEKNLPKKMLTNYKEIKDLKGLVLIEIIDEGIGMNEQEIDLFLQGRGKEIDKTQLGRKIETFGIGMNIVKDEAVRNNVIIEVESKLGEGSKIKLWFEVKNDYNEVSEELDDEYFKKQQLIKKSLDDIKFNHYNIISNSDNIHRDNKIDKQNIINDDAIKNISDDDRAIIIAEDQPVIAMLLEMNLNKILKKPHIIKVSDGYDVLRTLEIIACKMIFLDNDMPNLNGMETVKMIRNQQFNNNINSKNIVVIANSVNDDTDSIASFINSGANKFIDKTPTTENLANLLKEFANKILAKS